MHSDWDLISMDFPEAVFSADTIADKGQHCEDLGTPFTPNPHP